MNRIAELRKEKGLSQSELGQVVGVAQNTICNWENGSRQFDSEMLIKLAKYFDVTTDYLLGLVDERKIKNVGDLQLQRKIMRAVQPLIEESIRLNKVIDSRNNEIEVLKEEIKKYDRALEETYKKVQTLDRDKPMMKKRIGDDKVLRLHCPVCDMNVSNFATYCSCCGQRLE